MKEPSLKTWESFAAYMEWLEKDQGRVSYEWDREHDGSEASGIAINDRQCARITQARDRHGITAEVLRMFTV